MLTTDKMAQRDGKNKFYKTLKISDEIKKLIRYYNKILKVGAYKSSEKSHCGTSGKITTG